MQKRQRQPPTYRQRKGYDQAIVTLTDSVAGYRKDHWLGTYGSPESRELYHRVLAQWESGGRRLPVTLDDRPADIAQVSVAEVINAYWKWAAQQYGHSELGCLRVVIRPVTLEQVEAVRPYLSRQVNALVSLQLYTGARGGELFQLRPIDIQIHEDSGIWTIEPAQHKTAYRGHARTIFLGPRSQAVIAPFLVGRPVDAYLFSPADAEDERRAAAHARRRTPPQRGNGRGASRREAPQRTPGDHYNANSYRVAIQRACDRAFHPPDHLRPAKLPGGRRETRKAFLARLSETERTELRRWREQHRWHPHQLRHAAGTLIRRQFGLEAAQLALGHSSAKVTDAVYAERDTARVVEVMKRIG